MDAPFRAVDEQGQPWSSGQVAGWLRDSGQTVLLAMSRGKDSLAAWTFLRDHGIPTVPFHMDLIPGLRFVDDSIRRLENVFGQHVVRLPHPFFYDNLRGGLFQPPWMRELTSGWVLPKYTNEDVARIVCEDHGLDPARTWTVTGVRSDDSPMRYTAMRRYGPVSQKTGKVHLVWDWSKAQVYAALYANRVPLPVDYLWFGRTFDGVDYRFVEPLKQHAPEDYATVRDWFPLIDAEWRRHRTRLPLADWQAT